MRKLFFNNHRSARLAGDYYPGKKRTLLIACHGFRGNRKGLFLPKLCKAVSEAGFPVFSFDFEGSGESQGTYFDLSVGKQARELKSAIDFLFSKKLCKAVVLCGHSLGGMVAFSEAIKDERVKGLVLIAPLLKRNPKWNERYEKLGIIEYFEDHFEIKGLKMWNSFLKYKGNLLPKASKFKKPLLLVQGTRDENCSVEVAREFYSKLKCKRKFVELDGARHLFQGKGEAKKVCKKTSEWMEENFS
jgi:alpha-beta hydrolase superfamily lysophospholipase